MKNICLSLIATVLLLINGLLATAAPKEVLDKEQLLGQWTGVLPVPGGSRTVAITVSLLPDGSTAAVLHMNAARTNNSAMRIGSSADSMVSYADKAGCRFAGQPVANGQRLRGLWQQPGFRAVLVLDRVAPTGNEAGAALAGRPAATYRTENVRVSSASSTNSEIGLGGTLNLPAGNGPFPAVVLLSDVGTPE